MDSIGNQFFINNVAASNAAKAYARNSGDVAFSTMMATRSASADGLNGMTRPDVNPALTMALKSLLGNYGINVPPKLRMLPSDKGYKLDEDDTRGDKFGQLVKDHPGVADLLAQTQTQALAARDTAMETAIDSFMSGKSGYDTKGFLTEFRETAKPRAISIVYDGEGTQVEELDGETWRPVKGESDFMADLIKAYTRYSVTNTATAEHNRKNEQKSGLPSLPQLKTE